MKDIDDCLNELRWVLEDHRQINVIESGGLDERWWWGIQHRLVDSVGKFEAGVWFPNGTVLDVHVETYTLSVDEYELPGCFSIRVRWRSGSVIHERFIRFGLSIYFESDLAQERSGVLSFAKGLEEFRAVVADAVKAYTFTC